MRGLGQLLLASGLLAACSSTPTVIPTRNLDRPTDMGFVCLAMVTDTAGQSVLSGQPMDVCHPRGAADPTVVNDGQRTLGTFAFLPNAGRGELAVADLDRGRLLDLGPQSPGYGMLPISGGPEVLATSKDGCLVAMANRTSCDFTLVDPARLLASTFSGNSSTVSPATGEGETSRHLLAQTATGRPLRTAVGEIAFLPSPAPVPACQASAIHRAVATFPGCDLVALLDLSYDAGTARITSAYYVRPGGFEDAGAEPVCPDDCGPPPGPDAGPNFADGGIAGLDGAASHDAGASLAPPYAQPLHVQPLALLPDGSRVYVGGYHDSAITSFAVTDAGLAAPERTELAESPGGVSRLRLNVDPFLTSPVVRPDGTTGKLGFLDARGSFLYAFTADNSIRVVNLDGPAPVECDVNIVLAPEDPQRTAACLPVGTPGRRPLAQGPGIRIPTPSNPDTPPPLPRDVAFADLQPVAGNTNYHALSGQFGFVLASIGQVYVLNLAPNGEDGRSLVPADTCLPDGTSKLPVVATHSFREARDVGRCAPTPIAVSIAPQRQVLQTDQAFATAVTFSALEGPQIESFSRDGGETTSWFDFPDPDTIISRSWDVVWEGALPGTTRASGIVHNASEAATAGALQDAGANFCGSGVQSGDIVIISGCTRNSDCQPDDKFSCQISVSGARGMCLPIESSASEDLIGKCARFMGSRMRYEVARAEPTRLTLRLKLDEVPKTTLNPCTQDADCQPDTEHGSLSAGNPDGGGQQPFRCIEVRPQERRCVQSCSGPSADSECRPGHVCETVPWTSPVPLNLCVQAPPVDERCFPQPMTSYSVRAGQAFVVYGSSMPSPHNGRVVEGTCAYDAAANPTFVNRIPLSAPPCPESFGAPGSAPVQTLPAQTGANPCLYPGSRNNGAGAAAGADPIRAFFQNPQIRFVLTNLDAYAGDLLQIHFELQYGFVPMTVQIPRYEVLLTLGTRILTGPTKTPESPIRRSTGTQAYPYLYVVDQGRTALTPGSRGQVLRINARAGSSEIATFDTAMSGSTPFQLQ